MAEILVLVDHGAGPDGPAVRKTTTELLTLARRLGSPSAVYVGDGSGLPDAVRATLAEYGAERVYVADDAELVRHLSAPKAEVLSQIAGDAAPGAVLLTSSPDGKEIAGRLAVRLGSGLVTDAVDVVAGDTGPVTTQSVFAGNVTVTARVTHGVPVITVKPNSVDPEPAPAAAEVVPVAVSLPAAAAAATVVESAPRQATGRPDLSEAAIVVSGGRGTGGDFAPVEELADALGAAVGASRAAVDSGWYPHAYQVGQTGKTVSPQLYVAAGISGAIQHRAGMQTSKTIVAVNKDAEAPIFALVDFGVVGDLHAVLPQASAEIRKRQG
jgi:electron transfer flavoprotein alpha subunit